MSYIQPTILVLFGVSGNLAKNKLLPALSAMAKAEVLPSHFKIIGISRQSLTVESITEDSFLRQALTLYQMDPGNSADYTRLRDYLEQQAQEFPAPEQRVVYASLPPKAVEGVIEGLGQAGIIRSNDKLLLEKPFGTDFATAEILLTQLHRYFQETQLYRIDHYMAKEMAQNIVTFRSSNTLFKRTWNNAFIESITVLASEVIDIEGRAEFYEQTGALRDVIQNHLIQLVALILMELPAEDDWAAIPGRRLQAIKQLQLATDAQSVRAQYKGYRVAVDNPDSMIETFASVTLQSTDPTWRGVPIHLVAGKALDRKVTEITIRYHKDAAYEANELTLRVQPNEGVEMTLWAKEPGYERHPHQVPLSFLYQHHFNGLPEAYERVLVDVMRADHSLFTTGEEVLASWKLLQPLQELWQAQAVIRNYTPGTSPEVILQSYEGHE